MSSDKQQITINVSARNLTWLDANYNNRSAYIDDLLTKAREGDGHIDEAIRRMEIRNLKNDISETKESLEMKERRLQKLQSQQEKQEQKKQELLQDAREALADTPHNPENDAIQNWAEKLELTPEELIEKLDE